MLLQTGVDAANKINTVGETTFRHVIYCREKLHLIIFNDVWNKHQAYSMNLDPDSFITLVDIFNLKVCNEALLKMAAVKNVQSAIIELVSCHIGSQLSILIRFLSQTKPVLRWDTNFQTISCNCNELVLTVWNCATCKRFLDRHLDTDRRGLIISSLSQPIFEKSMNYLSTSFHFISHLILLVIILWPRSIAPSIFTCACVCSWVCCEFPIDWRRQIEFLSYAKIKKTCEFVSYIRHPTLMRRQ